GGVPDVLVRDDAHAIVRGRTNLVASAVQLHLDSAACGKRLLGGERGAGPGRARVHRAARKRGERGGDNDRESGVGSHGRPSYAEVGLPAEARARARKEPRANAGADYADPTLSARR